MLLHRFKGYNTIRKIDNLDAQPSVQKLFLSANKISVIQNLVRAIAVVTC